MPLTDTAIKKTKPSEKAVKLSDSRGMYLLVNPTGSKLWRWKYRFLGKEKVMALGAYPDVSLAQAREGVDKARKTLAMGEDPMAVRKADKVATHTSAENSFETVARLWWEHWKPTLSEQHAGQVMRRLEADVFPHIGGRPVSEIQAPEMVTMLKVIAGRGVNDLAKRALQTSSQVFRYAIAHGQAKRNPATEIKPSDVLPSRQKQNLARIDGKELPQLLRHIEGYKGSATTRLAEMDPAI
jgi:hypothetical protein